MASTELWKSIKNGILLNMKLLLSNSPRKIFFPTQDITQVFIFDCYSLDRQQVLSVSQALCKKLIIMRDVTLWHSVIFSELVGMSADTLQCLHIHYRPLVISGTPSLAALPHTCFHSLGSGIHYLCITFFPSYFLLGKWLHFIKPSYFLTAKWEVFSNMFRN